MRKILLIILSCTLILGLIGCGNTKNDDNNKETNQEIIEQNESNDKKETNDKSIAIRNTWYDEVDWNNLAKKENVELVIFDTLDYPYNIFDIKDKITEFYAGGCFDKSLKFREKAQDVDTYLSDNYYMYRNFSTTSGNYASVHIEDDSLELSITSTPQDNTSWVNPSNAMQKGEYFYFAQYDPDKLLGIDMNDDEGYERGEIILFLDRVIEKFGKPTKINMDISSEINNEDYSLNQKYYDLVWEFEKYTIVLSVQESVGAQDNEGKYVRHDADASAYLYTDVSWKQYKEYKENKEN